MRTHVRTCLIYEQHPDHEGWCPQNEQDLDDYWEAWAWARAQENELRRMIQRVRHGLVEQVREKAYEIGGDSPSDAAWGVAAMTILERD